MSTRLGIDTAHLQVRSRYSLKVAHKWVSPGFFFVQWCTGVRREGFSWVKCSFSSPLCGTRKGKGNRKRPTTAAARRFSSPKAAGQQEGEGPCWGGQAPGGPGQPSRLPPAIRRWSGRERRGRGDAGARPASLLRCLRGRRPPKGPPAAHRRMAAGCRGPPDRLPPQPAAHPAPPPRAAAAL